MRVVSFFSGAGGMDLGFILAGHDIIWANDFDKYASLSYEYNIGKFHPHKFVEGDITKVLTNDRNVINNLIPDSDIIIGGFPCQGFSIANNDRSMTDKRNFLYLELLKAISVKKPKYFLLENVKGLENMEKGQVLDMIMSDLEVAGTSDCKVFPDDGCGYSVFYNVFNALEFGVPQNRERVIIFGVRNDVDIDFGKIIKIDNKHIKKNPRKKLWIQPTHSKDSEILDKESPINKINKLYSRFINNKSLDNFEINIYSNDLYKYATLQDTIKDLPLQFQDDDLTLFNHVGSNCKVKISNRVGNRATEWNKYAPTIMGRGSGTGGPLIPPHPEKHRRFSVREVARIQTFPDNFIFQGPNSAAYRQIGNAVPVLMAYNIAKKIFSSSEK